MLTQGGGGEGHPLAPWPALEAFPLGSPMNAGFHAAGLEPRVTKAICSTWINQMEASANFWCCF